MSEEIKSEEIKSEEIKSEEIKSEEIKSEENQTKCTDCGALFNPDDSEGILTHEGHPICENCRENYSFCEESGEYFPSEEIIEAWYENSRGIFVSHFIHQDTAHYVETDNGEFWKESDTLEVRTGCRTTKIISKKEYNNGDYFTCSDCDEIWESNNDEIWVNDSIVCFNCSDSYSYCEHCENYYHSDNGPCCENESCSTIHSYSFTPKLNFRGQNSPLRPFIGFELEIEAGKGSRGDQAGICQGPFSEDEIYLKEDGSLTNGFEIVSHPSTLDHHRGQAYKAMLDDLSKSGAKSHDTRTCGLHFHLDKRTMKDSHKVRFGLFFAILKSQLEVLARRKESNYAKFKDKFSNSDKKTYAKNSDRYEAVNWQNDNTVEVRIFKGTLKYETFMASMELCNAIFVFTSFPGSMSGELKEEIIWKKFTKFLSKNKLEYSFLLAYLESKKEALKSSLHLDTLLRQKMELESKILKTNKALDRLSTEQSA